MKKIFICIFVFVLVSSAFGKLEITDIEFAAFPKVNVHVAHTGADAKQIEFTLTEDGKEVQELKTHLQEPSPKAVVLIFDVSKSIDNAMFAHGKQIANSFVESKSPEDLIAIMRFGERSEVVCEFNSEKDVLLKAISTLKIESGKTALNDAIYDSLTLLSSVANAEKCVIAFSDGKEENSALILEDSISLAKQRKIKVHTVGLADNPKTLMRISKLTDGKHLQAMPRLRRAFYQGIFGLPKHEFILTYESSVERETGPKRISLTVKARVDDAIETAEKGFQIEPGKSSFNWKRTVFISAGVIGLLLIGFAGFRIYRNRKRICSTCGREMLPEWTECPFCAEQAEQKRWTARLTSESGAEYGLTENTLIGRSQDNDIVLTHPSVSRQHALIKFEDGKHKIFDLGAKNDVLINNQRISESQLYEGDEIKLGEVSLVFSPNVLL